MALRALIVDDEDLARERLRSLIGTDPGIELIGECANGADAVAVVNATRPDVVFLDVEMAGLDGLGVAAAIERSAREVAIVFVTAYDRYAVDAFGVDAVDYLLKPFTRERFSATLERVRSRLAAPRSRAPQEMSGRLPVRTREGTTLVPIAEIEWIEADGNYARLHTRASWLSARETLAHLSERLGGGFLRIHRAMLVNQAHVLRVEPFGRGEYVVIMRCGAKLKSGRAFGDGVRRLIGV